jgi:hypothetical protein
MVKKKETETSTPKHSVTTIQISKETRELLKGIGKKGETYDDIIKKRIVVLQTPEQVKTEKMNPHQIFPGGFPTGSPNAQEKVKAIIEAEKQKRAKMTEEEKKAELEKVAQESAETEEFF